MVEGRTDAGSGDLLYVARSGRLLPTGLILTGGQYHHFTLEIDQQRRRYSLYVDDELVITDHFFNDEAGTVTDAAIATDYVAPEGAATETASAYLDNLLIQSGH